MFQSVVVNPLGSQWNAEFPQGTVLGPIIFSLYAQEILNIAESHGFNAHMYADDTQVYFQCDDLDLGVTLVNDFF